MINNQSGNIINEKSWKVVIISLVFVLIVIWVLGTFIMDTMFWSYAPVSTRFIITLVGVLFIYDRIILSASEWLVKLFEGLSEGKSFKESFDNTIELADPNEVFEENQRKVDEIIARIDKEEEKEKRKLEKLKSKKRNKSNKGFNLLRR